MHAGAVAVVEVVVDPGLDLVASWSQVGRKLVVSWSQVGRKFRFQYLNLYLLRSSETIWLRWFCLLHRSGFLCEVREAIHIFDFDYDLVKLAVTL